MPWTTANSLTTKGLTHKKRSRNMCQKDEAAEEHTVNNENGSIIFYATHCVLFFVKSDANLGTPQTFSRKMLVLMMKYIEYSISTSFFHMP
jgi:hypothetical protein